MSADPKAKKATSPKDSKEPAKSESKDGKAKTGEGKDEDTLEDEHGEQTEEQKRAVLDAENLMKQADKRLKSIGFLNKTKFDDALKLFEQAAAQYKLADEYQEAGDVYIKGAELIEEKMKNSDLSPVEYYLKAAQCYIGVSTKEALKIYDMAIKLLMDKNNFTYAARIWKDIAELHEKAGNRKACCEAWQKAADCYEAEHQKLHSYQCLLQIARLATVDRDYKRAIKLYEQVSTGIADSDLSKWNITDHLFKAALCQFVIDAKAGEDTKATQAALGRYPSYFAQFDNSREAKLLKALCKAYDDDDLKKFTEIVFKHDQVTKFDEWTAQMLLQVKTVLRDGVQAPNDDLASLDADGNLVASGKSEQDKKLEELV